jgi:hypothetical protein
MNCWLRIVENAILAAMSVRCFGRYFLELCAAIQELARSQPAFLYLGALRPSLFPPSGAAVVRQSSLAGKVS